MITARTKLAIAAAGALLLLLGVQTCRLAEANERARDNAFRADSAEAVADTSRDVTAQLAKLIGDSVRASELRILQVTPDRDAVDRALARTSATVASLSATVRGLEAVLTADTGTTTEDVEGVRRATFTIDSTPYRGTAAVTMPRLPAPASIALDLRLDTARIAPRIQCGAPVSGVRPASLLVTTPDWLTVTIDSVRSDPNVCNPEPEQCRIGPRFLSVPCPPWWAVAGASAIGGGIAGYQLSRSRK